MKEILTKGGTIIRGIEKESAKLVREVEKIGKISRTERFARIIRPIARS